MHKMSGVGAGGGQGGGRRDMGAAKEEEGPREDADWGGIRCACPGRRGGRAGGASRTETRVGTRSASTAPGDASEIRPCTACSGRTRATSPDADAPTRPQPVTGFDDWVLSGPLSVLSQSCSPSECLPCATTSLCRQSLSFFSLRGSQRSVPSGQDHRVRLENFRATLASC